MLSAGPQAGVRVVIAHAQGDVGVLWRIGPGWDRGLAGWRDRRPLGICTGQEISLVQITPGYRDRRNPARLSGGRASLPRSPRRIVRRIMLR